MKASRFIMNSDFATPKIVRTVQLVVALPNSRTVEYDQPVNYEAKINIADIKGVSYRVYITSSKYSNAIVSPNFQVAAKQDGYDASLNGGVYREGDNLVLRVQIPPNWASRATWTGMEQVITAHVQLFVDPFNII